MPQDGTQGCQRTAHKDATGLHILHTPNITVGSATTAPKTLPLRNCTKDTALKTQHPKHSTQDSTRKIRGGNAATTRNMTAVPTSGRAVYMSRNVSTHCVPPCLYTSCNRATPYIQVVQMVLHMNGVDGVAYKWC